MARPWAVTRQPSPILLELAHAGQDLVLGAPEVLREVDLRPRQPGDVDPADVLPLHEDVERVLVLVEPVAGRDHVLHGPDELRARGRPALEEADALADRLPRVRHRL